MKKSNEYFNQNSKSEEKRQRLAPHHLKYRIRHRYRTAPNLFHFHCQDLFYRFKRLYFWWSSWLASLSLSCWGICFQNLKWKIAVKWKQKEQDTVSTMQKTGLTNFSSFLVWSGLEKGHLWMWSLWGTQEPFSYALSYIRHADNQTNNQTTGWS